MRARGSVSMPADRSQLGAASRTAGRRRCPRSTGEGDRPRSRRNALHRRAEVLRPDGPAVRVAQPRPEREDVGPAVAARAAERSVASAPTSVAPARRRHAGRRRGRRRPARSGGPSARSCPSGESQSIGSAFGGSTVRSDAQRAAPMRGRRRRGRRPNAAVGDRDRRRAASEPGPSRAPGALAGSTRETSRPLRPQPTPPRRRLRPRSGRADVDRPRHRVRRRIDPRERPVVAVDDPHRALADRDRARAVADVDRAAATVPDRGSIRVTVPGLLARHPDRARAGGDRRRVRADGDRARRRAAIEIDPRRRSRRPPRRPTARRRRRPRARGALPTSIALHDLVGARVDLRDAASVAVGDPERSGTERERRRALRRRRSSPPGRARGRCARRCRRARWPPRSTRRRRRPRPGRGRRRTAP